jgi:hypothetical protein
MLNEPVVPHSAQITALEPSWALRYREPELRGLLVLAALFNERLYVHDTQLADHVLLVSSYLRHKDDEQALYILLEDLIRSGIVRVSLRTSVYVANRGKEIPISSLNELQSVFRERSVSGWVPPENFEARAKMLEALDQLVLATEPSRYNYSAVKQTFITNVRHFAELNGTEHYRLLRAMPSTFRSQYDALLDQSWFSFIDIIELCAKQGMRQDSLFVQSHGLIDEICYAEWNKNRMIGSNANSWQAEVDVSPIKGRRPNPDGLKPLAYLGDEASLSPILQDKIIAEIETPGLSLLGTLSIADILTLRDQGKDLFRLRILMSETENDFEMRFADAALKYWDEICRHIRSVRPVLATDRTKVAVFLRKELPTLSSWGGPVASFAIDAGIDALGMVLPGLAVGDALRSRIRNVVSLRFLFYGDSRELKQLKRCMPETAWLLSPSRKIDLNHS